MCMSCSIMPTVYSSAFGYFFLISAIRSSLTWVRKCIRVPLHQTNHGLPALCCRWMKSMARVRGVVIDRLHPFLGQRAGVLDLAVGERLDHAARAEAFRGKSAVGETHVAGIVLVLRFLLGIEVVEVAEELVEAVVGRQVLVAVAEVVLAELAGGVALVLEQPGDGRVLDLHAFLGAGQSDLGKAGAEDALAHDERRATGRAALLAVVVGEEDAFAGRSGRCWASGSPSGPAV